MGKEKNLEALDWGEAECREKIHEILDIVLDINSLGKREKNYTGNLPTAFFYFFGHVASLDISIHENGWEEYTECDLNAKPSTYCKRELEETVEALRRALEVLNARA